MTLRASFPFPRLRGKVAGGRMGASRGHYVQNLRKDTFGSTKNIMVPEAQNAVPGGR